MKPYSRHIFVCLGKRCSPKGGEEVLEEIKGRIKSGELEGVRVSRTGCLKVCRETDVEGEYSPVVIVYPEGVWYRNVTLGDVDEILDSHVKRGSVVERLLHFRMDGRTGGL